MKYGQIQKKVKNVTSTETEEKIFSRHCAWVDAYIVKTLNKFYIHKVKDIIWSWNNRLRNTLGSCSYLGKKYFLIELSSFGIQNTATLKRILDHELCHAVAYSLYGPDDHGDAWKSFMKILRRKPMKFYNISTVRKWKNNRGKK